MSDLLQASVTAGANQLSALRFFVADPSRVQSQGLELAFVNARAKAETLATLSKKSLGEVVCVSDNTIWQGGGVVGEMVGGLDPSVETGTQELTFSTYVVFELN